jgi:carboxypeptidase PM20D1
MVQTLITFLIKRRRALRFLDFLMDKVLATDCFFARASFVSAAGQAGCVPANVADLDKNKMAQRLARAVGFRTIAHEDMSPSDQEAFLDFQKFLERAFPKVHAELKKEIVGDYSLLFTWQGKDEKELPILLAAHMDVVPAEAETLGDWRYPPFEGCLADGFIWGRGTLDDKVSLLGILEAVEKLLQEGYMPRRTIYLAFGHDEEIGGHQGAAKIADMLHTRGVTLAYVLDEGLTITEGMMPGVSKPVAPIGIAQKGCLSIELRVESEGGHSMMPPPQTAIGILSSAIHKLEQNRFPARLEVPVRKMLETLAPEMPFGAKMVFSNLWLFERLVKKKLAASPKTNALVRTTVAPTIMNAGVKENILATRARAVVNFRLLTGDSIDQVWHRVRETINDPRVKMIQREGIRSEPSPVADMESQGYINIKEAVCRVFPQALVVPGLVIAATDSRHYTALTHNIFHFLPVRLRSEDLQRIHGKDERISIEDYADVVRFYMQLIQSEHVRHNGSVPLTP